MEERAGQMKTDNARNPWRKGAAGEKQSCLPWPESSEPQETHTVHVQWQSVDNRPLSNAHTLSWFAGEASHNRVCLGKQVITLLLLLKELGVLGFYWTICLPESPKAIL